MAIRISTTRVDLNSLPLQNVEYSDLNQIAAPGAPAAASKVRLYAKTDGKLYIIATGGTESGIGGASDLYAEVQGSLAATTGVLRWTAGRALTISKIKLYVDTLGTAGTTTVDVHKGGTTIFTTQGNRPALAFNAANKYTDGTPDTTAVVENDVLTVDIDGVATGASNAVVVIVLS